MESNFNLKMSTYFVKKSFLLILGTVTSIPSSDRYFLSYLKLNIYSFYKTKSAEKSMSFKNEIFRKGN